MLRLAPEAAAIPAVPLRVGAVLCRTVVLYSIRKGIVLKARPFLKPAGTTFYPGPKGCGSPLRIQTRGRRSGSLRGDRRQLQPDCLPGPDRDRKHVTRRRTRRARRSLALSGALPGSAGRGAAGDSWKAEVEDRLWRRGRPVRFLPALPAPDGVVEGLLEGVDDEGSLLLTLPGEGRARAFPSAHHRASRCGGAQDPGRGG